MTTKIPELTAKAPRYLQLANLLIRDIQDGKYPIGSMLPGEVDIAAAAGVARQTAREAIRCLLDRGLIVRRPGIGTIVKSLGAPARYVQSVGDISELFQHSDFQRYARETRLVIGSRSDLRLDDSTAALIGSRTGRAWIRLDGLRYDDMSEAPLAAVEIYLPAAYSAIITQIGEEKVPVYSLLESKCGVEIQSVRQRLRAAGASSATAKTLGIRKSSPILEIQRHYVGVDGEPVEFTISRYPADRFDYSMTLERDMGPQR